MSEMGRKSSYGELAPELVTLAYDRNAEFDAVQAAALTRESVIYDERLVEAASQRDMAYLAYKKGLPETDFFDCYRALIDHYSDPKRAAHLEAMLQLRQHLIAGEVFLSTRSSDLAVEQIAAGGDGQPLAQPLLLARSVNSGTYMGRQDTVSYDLVWSVAVEGNDQSRIIDTTNRLGRPAVTYFLDHHAGTSQMSDTARAAGYDLVGQPLKALSYRKLAAAKDAIVRARRRLPGQSS